MLACGLACFSKIVKEEGLLALFVVFDIVLNRFELYFSGFQTLIEMCYRPGQDVLVFPRFEEKQTGVAVP